ncbi:hypothetical protein ACGLWX_09650 [Halomonas sp. HMF6819]|uniref:hypothetical protein n=1 Tax=Halomonas sp. HMF6819 TaxID=3373085 RepID=UPI0037BC958D
MAFFDQYAHRLNQAAIDYLSDGTGTYHPGNGRDVSGVPYQLNLTFETIDSQGFSVRVRALTLPKDQIGELGEYDAFTVGDRKWRFNGLLEDDGYFVTFEVT